MPRVAHALEIRGLTLPPAVVRRAPDALAALARDPLTRLRIALAAVLLAALGSFAHLAEDYLTRDPLVRWDVSFAGWLHVHSSPTLVSVFEVVTYGGNAFTLALVTVLAGAVLLRRGALNEAALVAGAALGIELLNAVVKLLFHRPRPELAFVHLDTYSFPSGHAAGSTALYATIAFLVARRARPAAGWTAALVALLVVVVVGFSRLYLGVHYLSDVLAGVALGSAWAAACILFYDLRRDGDLSARLPRSVVSLLGRLGARASPPTPRSD
ncbi:MAG: phosphatase PAP2 family protein [Actinobacteria bacterium]|nr:phosphatase PAP2 family protein [Actinomycetota bacterium]